MDALWPFTIDLAASLELLNKWKLFERETVPTGKRLF